ncbi:TIGR04282 family arsenosugar biosynthesis glycosyltransferase [Solwaraspora sp. WMMB335]|uniref:TIGR04282 family arsenosugar biosynthesis glycosyltransferase n=1 Tax=Solwaraspora sp. WMMB335 TaxID=3404118 RepID=UPI003B92C110
MTVLLVMAKAPVAGRAKTRLCPPATPVQAARLATAALLDTVEAVEASGAATPVLALAGRLSDADGYPGAAEELAVAVAGWRVLPQRGDGFADRLANAYADVAAAYPGRPVLQIGMDTPQLTGTRLSAAAGSLTGLGRRQGPGRREGLGRRQSLGRRQGPGRREGTDAVLGFAADGGWWALGLRDPQHAEALRRVPMSTSRTGRDTWAALRGRGLRVASLPVLRDVDEWRDALVVADAIPGGRFAAQVATATAARVLVAGVGR